MRYQAEKRLTLGDLFRLVHEHDIDPKSTIYIGPAPGQGIALRMLLRGAGGIDSEPDVTGYFDLRTGEYHGCSAK